MSSLWALLILMSLGWSTGMFIAQRLYGLAGVFASGWAAALVLLVDAVWRA